MKRLLLVGFCLAAPVALGATVAMDFDGDKKSDIAVYDPAGGKFYILQSGTGSLRAQNLGGPELRPVLGDFDGDKKADVATYSRFSQQWTIVQSSNGQTVTRTFGAGDSRPVPGDYDGDGRTDLAVFQRSNGRWTIQYSSNGQTFSTQFGWNETRAVPADYDGDGKTDLAVFHRASGNWYISRSRDGFILQNWGWSQARPVPADYDGDGKADLAVYHLASGAWYVNNSSNGQLWQQSWGWILARPTPGDFDGDGRTDLAVFHRAGGDWYIAQSTTGGTLRKQNFGWSKTGALPSYRDGGIQNLVILAFGDSITYGTSSSSGGPATGYPILLEKITEPALGGHCVTINAGNPGETTSDGRIRLRGALTASKPDLTLLMQGTNDMFYETPYGTVESNLRDMVLNILGSGSHCIISTIPPVIKSAYRDRTRQEQLIEGFNPRIVKIASDYRIPLADNWKAITSVPNWPTLLIDQETANHPNDAGYRVMRDCWYRVLENATLAGLFY